MIITHKLTHTLLLRLSIYIECLFLSVTSSQTLFALFAQWNVPHWTHK